MRPLFLLRVLAGAVLLATAGACVPAQSYPLTAPRPQQTYPARFDVWSDDDLNAWARDLEHKTPGWRIQLDASGMLQSATCTACRRGGPADLVLTLDDRQRIDEFLTAHGATLLGLQGGKMQAWATDAQVFCRQRTSLGELAQFSIDRFAGTVTITGHLWPGMPPLEGWLSDDTLTAKLRAMDADAGLAVVHRYVHTQGAKEGSFEIREAACLASPAGVKRNASRPCIDARSGEPLVPLCEATEGPAEDIRRHFFVCR